MDVNIMLEICKVLVEEGLGNKLIESGKDVIYLPVSLGVNETSELGVKLVRLRCLPSEDYDCWIRNT